MIHPHTETQILMLKLFSGFTYPVSERLILSAVLLICSRNKDCGKMIEAIQKKNRN